jgi:hypothetical protein
LIEYKFAYQNIFIRTCYLSKILFLNLLNPLFVRFNRDLHYSDMNN